MSHLGTGLFALTQELLGEHSGYSSMLGSRLPPGRSGEFDVLDQIQCATAATAVNELTARLDRPCNA